MKTSLFVLFVFAATTAIAGNKHPLWPAGVFDPQGAEANTFYEATCQQWSDESRLQSEALQKFKLECMQDIASIYTIGFEEGDD